MKVIISNIFKKRNRKILLGVSSGLVIISISLIYLLFNSQFSDITKLNNVPENQESKTAVNPTNSPTITPSSSTFLISTATPSTNPLYDGSRTGNIVDHVELCTGNKIKIYENELLKYTDIWGEHLLTISDIGCLVKSQCKTLVSDAFRENKSCPQSDRDCILAVAYSKYITVTDKYFNWMKERFCKGNTICVTAAEKDKNFWVTECNKNLEYYSSNL